MSAPTPSASAPIAPVWLPLSLTGLLVCVITGPLIALSAGAFASASLLMSCTSLLSALVTTVGLAALRSGRPYGRSAVLVGAGLALASAAFIVYQGASTHAGALAGVSGADGRAMMQALADRERPWVYLAALLTLVPSVLGGWAGSAWIRAAQRRAAPIHAGDVAG